MKYNKKILEAINRGILLALDDYDEDQLLDPIVPKKDSIKKDSTLNWLILNFVDLDLPSGTLWAKCNLGADKPNQFGNYYQWGDIKPKTEMCIISTYKFYDVNKSYPESMSKYTFSDNLLRLLPEDDAAYLIDNRMKMPTKKLVLELLERTSQKWVTDKVSNGMLFIGKNGNEMFIPAAGYIHEKHGLTNIEGNIWTSDMYYDDTSDHSAIYLYLSESRGAEIGEYDKTDGFSIRPVANIQNK